MKKRITLLILSLICLVLECIPGSAKEFHAINQGADRVSTDIAYYEFRNIGTGNGLLTIIFILTALLVLTALVSLIKEKIIKDMTGIAAFAAVINIAILPVYGYYTIIAGYIELILCLIIAICLFATHHKV